MIAAPVTLVAITKWARPPAQEYAALAALLSIAPPDAKMLCAKPLPILCARMDSDAASVLVAALRARGHGAVAFSLAELPDHDDLLSPRTYSFEDRAFVADKPVGAPLRIASSDIVALVRARLARSSETTTSTTKKKFSMGRALATGGLSVRKKQTTETRHREVETEQALYVVSAGGRDWICMREYRLRHQGLGSRLRRTVMENFATLVTMLRELAPTALYDDRLLRQKRRSTLSLGATNEVSRSNASQSYVAANLIVRGHLEHQL